VILAALCLTSTEPRILAACAAGKRECRCVCAGCKRPHVASVSVSNARGGPSLPLARCVTIALRQRRFRRLDQRIALPERAGRSRPRAPARIAEANAGFRSKLARSHPCRMKHGRLAQRNGRGASRGAAVAVVVSAGFPLAPRLGLRCVLALPTRVQ